MPKPAVELTEDDWDSVIDTNLKGGFFLTTALARRWLDQGSPGAVVNIASQAGIVGIEERAAYGTSKAGLIHLTKILALEWASGRHPGQRRSTHIRPHGTDGLHPQPARLGGGTAVPNTGRPLR